MFTLLLQIFDFAEFWNYLLQGFQEKQADFYSLTKITPCTQLESWIEGAEQNQKLSEEDMI